MQRFRPEKTPRHYCFSEGGGGVDQVPIPHLEGHQGVHAHLEEPLPIGQRRGGIEIHDLGRQRPYFSEQEVPELVRRRPEQALAQTVALLHRPWETPRFELGETVTPSPHHPIGAKGVGESATVGSPAAFVNAVIDALEHTGIRNIEMPVSADRVWAAMEGASEK